MKRFSGVSTWIGVITLGLATTVVARPIEERVRSASEVVINRQTALVPVPGWVIDRAKCVASLRVVKVGLIWGGQGSTGLVTCRTEDNEWSNPSFFRVDGVNFGIQIGVQLLESVMVFVTDLSREVLNRATFQVGADLSFAAGPVGAGGGAGEMPNAHILSYQRAVGLYAGATINGFILAHNRRLNRQAYGHDMSPAEILHTPGVEASEKVSLFVDTMNRHMPLH